MANKYLTATAIENLLVSLWQGQFLNIDVPRTESTKWTNKNFRTFIENKLGEKVNPDQVRDVITNLRADGILPILANSKGYWFSNDPCEIVDYIHKQKNGYITTNILTVECLKRHLKENQGLWNTLTLPELTDVSDNTKKYGEFIDAVMGGKTQYYKPSPERRYSKKTLQEMLAKQFELTKPTSKGYYFSDAGWKRIVDYVRLVGDHALLSLVYGNGEYYTGNENEVRLCARAFRGKASKMKKAIEGLRNFTGGCE